jgi:hypothetical protein
MCRIRRVKVQEISSMELFTVVAGRHRIRTG